MELRTRMNTSPKRRVLEGDIDSEEEVRQAPCPERVFWENHNSLKTLAAPQFLVSPLHCRVNTY